MTKYERNYSVTQLEGLAAVWCIMKCRPYLYGKQFDLITDHSALQWLLTTSSPNGRIGRWMLQLQEYDFQVFYRPGELNIMADALSRNPINIDNKEEGEMVLAAMTDLIQQFESSMRHNLETIDEEESETECGQEEEPGGEVKHEQNKQN